MSRINSLFRRAVGRKAETNLSPADAAFMDDVRASLLSQKTPGTQIVLCLVAVVLLGALVWAYFARVEEITRGDAKIVARTHEQVIQSLEGGILEEMNVSEGDVVNKGQVLLKIDQTRASAAYQEALAKYIALKATVERLRAEAYGLPLTFSEEVKRDPAEVQLETNAYRTRLQALHDSVSAMQRSYDLATNEIGLSQPLADRGLMSQVEILRMRRQANEMQMQIVERKNRYQSEANAELIKLELELAQTRENLVGRKDILHRTTIQAPVHGTIKNVRFNTVGGVIQPGERILEIVPLEDRLMVETKIKPQDVAFLRRGLPATVKISAYDYAIYGGLTGKVEIVGADTVKDEQKAATGRPDDTYYRIMVLTDSSALHAGGKQLPIIPGMTATVEIRTGEKTVLEYLLKPLLKAREAFRER
jgi:adhesin transport system membrane fusion protein